VVAETGIVRETPATGDGPDTTSRSVLRAGDADVGHSRGAVRRADAAADLVEVGLAFRVINGSVLFAVASSVVGFAPRDHAVVVQPVAELPGIARAAAVG